MTGGRAAAAYAIAHHGSNNMITLRYRLKDLKVETVEQSFKDGTHGVSRGVVHRPANQSGKDVHGTTSKRRSSSWG